MKTYACEQFLKELVSLPTPGTFEDAGQKLVRERLTALCDRVETSIYGDVLGVVNEGAVLAQVPLPIAGLMSEADAPTLSAQLHELHAAAQRLGAKLRRPFMALSFLSLSVIGALKITDQGLVDVTQFKLIDLITS